MGGGGGGGGGGGYKARNLGSIMDSDLSMKQYVPTFVKFAWCFELGRITVLLQDFGTETQTPCYFLHFAKDGSPDAFYAVFTLHFSICKNNNNKSTI